MPAGGACRRVIIAHEPAGSCAAFARWSARRRRQIVRDPSSIAIGAVLPLILILLFGYGLSLDVKNVPVAVVIEYPAAEAIELAAGFQLSPYFMP